MLVEMRVGSIIKGAVRLTLKILLHKSEIMYEASGVQRGSQKAWRGEDWRYCTCLDYFIVHGRSIPARMQYGRLKEVRAGRGEGGGRKKGTGEE